MRRRGRDRYTPAQARLFARLRLPDEASERRLMLKRSLWIPIFGQSHVPMVTMESPIIYARNRGL